MSADYKKRVSIIIDQMIKEFENIMETTPQRLSDDKMVANMEKLSKIVELTSTWGKDNDELEGLSTSELEKMFNG